MFCPHCGAQVEDGSAFCPMCGQGIEAAPDAASDVREVEPPPLPGPPAQVPSQVPPPVPPPVPQVPVQPTVPMAPSPQAPAVPAAVPVAAAPAAAPYAGVYPKAPLGGRLLAVIVDGIIAAALLGPGILFLYAGLASGATPVLGIVLVVIGGVWELAYLLGRDGFGGAGFGKRLTGLVVVSSPGGVPTGVGASVVRQLVLFLLGIIPVIGSLIEPILVITDKDGRRLGDKAAKTQVARAADVAAAGHRVPVGKGLAVAALVVALLVSLIGSAVGGVMFARAVSDADGGGAFVVPDTMVPQTDDDPTAEQPAVSELSPADVVMAFYAAVKDGDSVAVSALVTDEINANVELSEFMDWGVPVVEVLSAVDFGDGTAMVVVEEFDNDASLGIVTYDLQDEDGWKIAGWEMTIDESDAGGDSPADALNPETATDAVGIMLNALIMDDLDTVREQATARFEAESPYFFESTGGAFVQFEIVDAYQDGGTYAVIAREEWYSGPEEIMYIVVLEDGVPRVDAQIFDF